MALAPDREAGNAPDKLALGLGEHVGAAEICGNQADQVAEATSYRAALVVVLVSLASPVTAQEPTPFRWPTHEAIPAHISDALIGFQLGAEAVHTWRAADRGRALRCQGLRTALTLAASEGLKRIVKRERPNHYDRKSFPSLHTALGAVSAGWRPEIGASITVGIAWGRQASGWHYATDVLVGAGIGLLATRVCEP